MNFGIFLILVLLSAHIERFSGVLYAGFLDSLALGRNDLRAESVKLRYCHTKCSMVQDIGTLLTFFGGLRTSQI